MCTASFGIHVVFGFGSGIKNKVANTQTTNIDSAETVNWIESHPVNLRPKFGIPEVPRALDQAGKPAIYQAIVACFFKRSLRRQCRIQLDCRPKWNFKRETKTERGEHWKSRKNNTPW